MASISSAVSSSDSWRSAARRLPMDALIEVSGVRRSCPTAESSVVRSSVASALRSAFAAAAAVRCWRNASNACPATASSTRLSAAGSARPRRVRWTSAVTAMSTSASSGSAHGWSPTTTTFSQAPPRFSSSVTEVRPKFSRTFASSRSIGFSWVSTVLAYDASSAASVLARAAWVARRAALSTTSATITATTTIAISVTRFCGVCTLSV